MPKKKGGTEAYLDTFNETLKDYERAVMERSEAVVKLAACDQKLEELRKTLLHLAGNNTPVAGLLPAPPSAKGKPAEAPKKKSPATKLEKLDPRIQRSMEATSKAIKGLGGSAHKTDIAKKLGISTQATIQRLSRGVKLGLLSTPGKGVYELRSS